MSNEIVESDETNLIKSEPTTPATLLQLAINQGADLDRLEKLMDLQTRWEEGEAKKQFTIAMASFRADCPVITKDKEGHNSKYASLAHTIGLIKDQLSTHSLSHNWKTEQDTSNGLITVTCCVTHKLGHQEFTKMSAQAETSGSKNAIQAIGSTISYLERYTLYAILGLASTDQDDDGKASGKGGKSAEEIEKEWVNRMAILREILPSVLALKENIALQEYGAAYEAWNELTKEEVSAVWYPAPTKGGILTTQERTLMQSNEWVSARNKINGV